MCGCVEIRHEYRMRLSRNENCWEVEKERATLSNLLDWIVHSYKNYLLSTYVILDTVLGSKITTMNTTDFFKRKNDQGKQYCKGKLRAEVSVKWGWRSFRYLREEILAEGTAASKVLRRSKVFFMAKAEWVWGGSGG